MDSFAPTPAGLVQPWRTATLVAVGVALVELALVIALAVTLLSASDGAAPAAAAAKHRPARPHAILPRTQTRVLILNGNGQPGAAASQAEVVQSLSYPVADVGNASRSDYGRTTVLYPAGRQREARRLAHDLGLKLVGPLDGMSKARLHGATVALILGR